MSAIFADTFYFIGLMNRMDRMHESCVRFSRGHQGIFVTTSWVLVEVADAWASSPQRIQAGQLAQTLPRNRQFQVVPPAQSLLDRAVKLYVGRQDKEWSLTDCISFVVMADEGLTEALTGDHHFEQAGFTILLKRSRRGSLKRRSRNRVGRASSLSIPTAVDNQDGLSHASESEGPRWISALVSYLLQKESKIASPCWR